MIGQGTAFPQNPHHAVAQAGHLRLDGAIVGGPTSMAVLRDSHDPDPSLPLPQATGPFAPDDLVYDDATFDYVVNEPAIDFTAPLVFDLAELEVEAP